MSNKLDSKRELVITLDEVDTAYIALVDLKSKLNGMIDNYPLNQEYRFELAKCVRLMKKLRSL